MLLPELREFIRDNLRSFVKDQRQKAQVPTDTLLNGYCLKEVEESAEKIPCCDLMPILEQLAQPQDLCDWWVNFQIQVYEIKTKGLAKGSF